MRRILKYLLPLLCVVAFCGNADDSCTDHTGNRAVCFIADADADDMEFEAADQEFCLPRPVSLADTQRVQTLSRRSDTGQRQGSSFIKAGKVISTGTSFFTRYLSGLFPSGLSEPAHRLISLGKLLI